ncbi:MAG TPA: diacylglycerol kinase family protein [Hyphomicrobiaceae bacterium]|nr:diacylglycerol kinase family protein [Hyphomicrobiaceae bacterium]
MESTRSPAAREIGPQQVPFLRAHAVINSRSGAAASKSPGEIEDILASALAVGARKLIVDVVEPEQVEAKLKQAAGGDADAIIVGGGDGTVRTAASLLLNSDKRLGILPLGTLNRLARDLGIPLDMQAAALALAKADIKAIDVAMVQDRVFLCNSMIGLTPELTEQRQRLRGRPIGERLAGYADVLLRLWRSRRGLVLTVEDAKKIRLIRALSLVVSNNCYAEKPGLVPRRPQLDLGRLGLYVSKHRRGSALLGVLLKVTLGRWRSDHNIEHVRGRRIVIDSTLPRIKTSNDGEIETLAFPLTYSIRPLALQVLVPSSSAWSQGCCSGSAVPASP